MNTATTPANTPPLVLIGESKHGNIFYATMLNRTELADMAKTGANWRDVAVQTVCDTTQSPETKRNALQKAIGIAAKRNALVFHLSPTSTPAEQQKQLTTLCELYDFLLQRIRPAPVVVCRWRGRLIDAGVLPYGQPYNERSTYRPLVVALVPYAASLKL